MAKIEITEIESLNHNVKRMVTTKPEGFTFKPGQATMVSLDEDGQQFRPKVLYLWAARDGVFRKRSPHELGCK